MYASLLVALGLTFALIGQSQGRYYTRPEGEHQNYAEWSRGKRQSHPDVTIARLPEIPFGETTPGETTIQSAQVPEPAEYLLPPALDTQQQFPSFQPAKSQPSEGKWDLGYDASDLLVPPVPDDQALQYDTMKLFNFPPPSGLQTGTQSQDHQQGLLESFGPVEQEPAATNGRAERFESYSPEFRPSPEENKSPVYSFVKTDPQGHFKWGVHLGGA